MTGKDIRLRKFVDENSNNIVLLPIDHGITLGPIHGIKNMEKTLKNFLIRMWMELFYIKEM